VWPTTLTAPPDGQRIVYLDLNHWINLAKAATGKADGVRFQDALQILREASRSGRFLFPAACPAQPASLVRTNHGVTSVISASRIWAMRVSSSIIAPLSLVGSLLEARGLDCRND
jgi:hypothetical protein